MTTNHAVKYLGEKKNGADLGENNEPTYGDRYEVYVHK
jgi:hypothetical protein